MKYFIWALGLLLTLPAIAANAQLLSPDAVVFSSGGVLYSGDTYAGSASIGLPMVGTISGGAQVSNLGLYVRLPWDTVLDVTPSPAILDFGTVNAGHSVPLTAVITNNSKGEVTLLVNVGAPTDTCFVITKGGGSFPLLPSAQDTVSITYTADGKRDHSATILVTGPLAKNTQTITLNALKSGVTTKEGMALSTKLFPNPTSGAFIAILPGDFGVATSVLLLDEQGKTMRDLTRLASREGEHLSCKLPPISDGTYFLRVEGKATAVLYKLVIKK